MNIGAASRQSGVSARMIRHYEGVGLIPPAARRDSGYRDYSEQDVHMLRFIGRARDLGFTMAEIAGLLDLWQNRERRSADVKRIAEARLDDIERRIAEMQTMAETLRTLSRDCAGDARPDCPILDDLARASAATATATTSSTGQGAGQGAGQKPFPRSDRGGRVQDRSTTRRDVRRD